MADKARDIMDPNVECAQEDWTLVDTAKRMAELDVGAMPICGNDDRLKGMITDRDIVVKALAQGKDPSSAKVAELAQGKPVTIGADDSIDEVLATMKQHQVRRLPVIDGHELVGIISTQDIAHNVPEEKAGEVLEAVTA
jgi:CBS domain-containing protein